MPSSRAAPFSFLLFLALLASATAAPTTKGRRANVPPIRLVVTDDTTNVATTTSGARASNQVAQMAAALGGNVTMKIRAAHKTFTVVEVVGHSKARAFKEQAEQRGLRVEEDQRRYPATSSATRKRQLAEETPWGISRVYNGVVPAASFFPSTVTHPLCIIDSGYLLTHPDLPSDATAADPSQASGTMYFGGDLCDHGTHVLILSAAPLPTTSSAPPSAPPPPLPHTPSPSSPPPSVPPGTHVAGTIAAIRGNGEGVVGVYPGAPDLKIVKVFGTAGSSGCGWSWASSLVQAVQRCVDSGAKIVSSERA